MNSDLQKFYRFCGYQEALQLCYFASPYFHEDPKVIEERVKIVEDVIVAYINSESNRSWVFPISPVLYTHNLQNKGAEPLLGWYTLDLALLKKADKMIVLAIEGWKQSIGVQLEIAAAKVLGIPIHIHSPEYFLENEKAS